MWYGYAKFSLGRVVMSLYRESWGYCGHYHIEKSIDRMWFLYKGVLILGD